MVSLHNLHALRLSWSSPEDLDYTEFNSSRAFDITELEKKIDFQNQLDIIHANHATLRELHVLCDYLSDIPVQIFSSLTHLEIFVSYGHRLTDLPLVFRHAGGLESLVLAGDIWLQDLSLETNVETLIIPPVDEGLSIGSEGKTSNDWRFYSG